MPNADDIVPDLKLASGFPAADDSQWRALVDKVLKGADFRDRLVSRTADGIEIEPLYTRKNSGVSDFSGSAPIADPSDRRGWRIAEVRTETTLEALLAGARTDIEEGADGLTIRLAAPGQSGLPAGLRSLDDALAALPLERVLVSFEPGSHAVEVARALERIAHARHLRIGRVGVDPLGTLARTGELTLLRAGEAGFTASLPLMAPPVATLIADARPYHEAGASEAQEIAALASTLVAYLRALEGLAVAPAAALAHIALAMSVDADIFLGIAKLRAARLIVFRIAEACGAAEAAGRMQLAVTTSERMMTRHDPHVNLLRVTAACAASAMAGADEIAVLPHTWAQGQPDAAASRIARNVGLVLREEAGLGRIADPAGGAWAVERLTGELAAKAWGIFQAWESAGGMLAALTCGRVQDEIGLIAEARSRDIAMRRFELTGVSAFPQLDSRTSAVTPWPSVPAPATPGIARPLRASRLAEPFEALRDAADRARGTGSPGPDRTRVFLAALGPQSEHAPRSIWITNLLAAGGIGVVVSDGLTSSTEAGRAFSESGAHVACICGADSTTSELGEAAAIALKAAGATHVAIAGRPGASEDALRAAGVDTFLHTGIDVVSTLSALHRELGIET